MIEIPLTRASIFQRLSYWKSTLINYNNSINFMMVRFQNDFADAY